MLYKLYQFVACPWIGKHFAFQKFNLRSNPRFRIWINLNSLVWGSDVAKFETFQVHYLYLTNTGANNLSPCASTRTKLSPCFCIRGVLNALYSSSVASSFLVFSKQDGGCRRGHSSVYLFFFFNFVCGLDVGVVVFMLTNCAHLLIYHENWFVIKGKRLHTSSVAIEVLSFIFVRSCV